MESQDYTRQSGDFTQDASRLSRSDSLYQSWGEDSSDTDPRLEGYTSEPPKWAAVKEELSASVGNIREEAGRILGSVGRGMSIYVGGPPPTNNPGSWGKFLCRALGKVCADTAHLGIAGAKGAVGVGKDVVHGSGYVIGKAAGVAKEGVDTLIEKLGGQVPQTGSRPLPPIPGGGGCSTTRRRIWWLTTFPSRGGKGTDG
jgi:hypothetical protein